MEDNNNELFDRVLEKIKKIFPNYNIYFKYSKKGKRAGLYINDKLLYSIEIEFLLREYSFFSERPDYIDIISSIFEDKIIKYINKLKKENKIKRNRYIYFNNFPPPLNITVDQLKDALYTGKSLKAASQILKISYPSVFKYARKFKVIDEETGKEISLYEKFKYDCERKFINLKSYSDLHYEDVVNGNIPKQWSEPTKLKLKLIKMKYIKEECSICGFSEKRITDQRSPLVLHYKDFNPENKKLSNLELLCYNCYFLTVGNVFWYRPVYIKRK